MNRFAPDHIRNVALVGHGGAGKTTLTEALLTCAGVLQRPGRVEDGTATTDFEPEEVKHQISISLGLVALEYNGYKINLIDCPGFPDFVAEVGAALSVADLAVFVVSAVEGVEAQTEELWRFAADRGIPRIIFVNKLDRDRASFDRTLEQMREMFGAGIAPLELPIGDGASFHGVADLLTDTAITYDDGVASKGAIPDDMEPREHEVHDNLVEGIVVADDALMERYLAEDTPSPEELEHTLAVGVAAGSVFPVIGGSATNMIAIDRLADFICEIGPPPTERPVKVSAGDSQQTVAVDPSAQTLASVFKTVVDPYVGKISLMRVHSGTLKPDVTLQNVRLHHDERLHALFTLRGKDQEPVPEAPAGDLVATSKLGDTLTGDTLSAKGSPVRVAVVDPPEPVFAFAVRPRSKGDEDKLMTALHRLQEEDVALRIRRDDETRQLVLAGMGDTHLNVTLERLSRRFNVEVDVEDVRVPYRETIAGPATAEGRYKKQSGGHGQFGVVELRVEPLAAGSGFEFVDEVVGGAIPRQFLPAVEKGIHEAMSAGSHGFPVVDVRAVCFDGKHHPVDSSEMSFKMAGALGFREALSQAGSVVLEPVSTIEVDVPDALQGDVLGDLNARRGRVQNSEPGNEGRQVITAQVPTSEITRYALDLRSLTGGRGRFHAEHSHYEPMPAHLADKFPKPE